MDQYKASIESVDSALNRLNQTLASYRLLSSETARIQTSSISHADTDASSATNGNLTTPATPKRQHEDASRSLADPQPPVQPQNERSEIDQLILSLRATRQYPERDVDTATRVNRVKALRGRIEDDPYCLPLYLVLAAEFAGLQYPDLAAGACYKALLLSDALDNEAEEYHEEATESLKQVIQQHALEERIGVIKLAMEAEMQRAIPSELDPSLDVELTLWLNYHYRLIMYRLLTCSLLQSGDLRSALTYSKQALDLNSKDEEFHATNQAILNQGSKKGFSPADNINNWPDHGLVRREIYPWNDREPDRFNILDEINELMSTVADKLEVRAVELPALAGSDDTGVSLQLGVFATQDIAPGEKVLSETSLLTANNKLQDALCDACSADLPVLDASGDVVSCPDCEVVFCTQTCHDAAMESYHPALCDKDIEAVAKDVPPTQAADSLYSLLLLRALAMAETQELHPLDLPEVKFIWGDFTASTPSTTTDHPRTLPFSFEHNIRLPFHMLEKMDIDIFANPQYDVWVFNTLYAKFRGTASARLSGLGGGRKIRGPEVSAVHPMWCLANHSCDPNVSWEWGGKMEFWCREERVRWAGKSERKSAGIQKDEEIFNHYCDVRLPVQERREWARGALGGDCMCERCVWEAQDQK